MKWKGKFFVKPPPAKKGEINYAFLDRFSLIHLAIGMAYGFIGLHFASAIFLALAWEFFENPLKVHFSFLFPHATADTIQNMIGDILAVTTGWLVHRILWS